MTLLQNNIKELPRERLCIIDGAAIINDSLKRAFVTLQGLGIKGNLWRRYEKDIKSVFYFYCIESLYHHYNTLQTKYRKVYVFEKNNKNTSSDNFIKNNLHQMLKSCTFPWCEINTLRSPELGIIASRAFEKQKTTINKLTTFLEKHKLYKLTNKIKKNMYRQKNTVDFSGVTE
jgi:hypothetical protein